jgi:hypothetical protein
VNGHNNNALPMEFNVHPSMRLGWRGPTAKTVLEFDRYLTGQIPPTPATADFMSNVGTWCGRTNFHFGTCGPNSVANLFTMWFMYALGEQITISDDAIFDLYRRSGNPYFNPATGAGDNGVDTAVMLAAMQSGPDAGLDITRENGNIERHTVAAYGKLTGQGPMLIDQLRNSTALFGGAIIGVMLEVAQQAQTRAQPPVWTDIPSSPDWGGHDIFGGRYLGDEGDDEQVISWLVKVGISDGFIRRRAMELFVAVPKIALSYKPVADGINWSLLADDFQQLTGNTPDFGNLSQ